jgi:hypothetical protein
MYQRNYAKDQAWMTDDERAAWKNSVRRIRTMLNKYGVPTSPFLMIRIRELATLITLAHRLEAQLPVPAEHSTETLPQPNLPGQARPAPLTAPSVEAVAKQWERVRKAISELEAYRNAKQPSRPMGIADVMRPIMLKARAILKDHPELQEPGNSMV